MSLDEALANFGKAVGALKRAYGEEECVNPDCLSIIIDDHDYITIIPTNETGSFHLRSWVDTDEP